MPGRRDRKGVRHAHGCAGHHELNTWGWWWGTHQLIDQARYAYQVSLMLDANQPEVQEALDDLIHQP
jgi:hypothetical protein